MPFVIFSTSYVIKLACSPLSDSFGDMMKDLVHWQGTVEYID